MGDNSGQRRWNWWMNERASFFCQSACVFKCQAEEGDVWYIVASATLPDGHTTPVILRHPYDNPADAIIAVGRVIGEDGYAKLGQNYWFGDVSCGVAVAENGHDEAFWIRANGKTLCVYDGAAFALPPIAFSDFDARLAYLEFLGPFLLQIMDDVVQKHGEGTLTLEYAEAMCDLLSNYVQVSRQADRDQVPWYHSTSPQLVALVREAQTGSLEIKKWPFPVP